VSTGIIAASSGPLPLSVPIAPSCTNPLSLPVDGPPSSGGIIPPSIPLPPVCMQFPLEHVCPLGQTAPAHASVHAPLRHTIPAGHVIESHPFDTQWPVAIWQTSPAGHIRHGHRGSQTPPSQTAIGSHIKPLHGSTQSPLRQT
jgi:hypothetical protein